MDWGFGDFQSLKTSPGEHPKQPIGPSQLEGYFSAFERCCARIGGILKSGTLPGEFPEVPLKRYKELDAALIEERPRRSTAVAQMRLIGMKPISEKIEETVEVERMLREQVIFKKQLPTRDELSKTRKDMEALRGTIYDLMAKEFERNSVLSA